MLNKFFIPVSALVFFSADRLTKMFLPVQKFYNEGAAFGILQGQGAFLTTFSFLVLGLLIFYTIKENNNPDFYRKSGLGLIMGGVAGNLYDRVFYGHVIDFIDINFINFPIFNLADVFINTGAGILLISLLVRK